MILLGYRHPPNSVLSPLLLGMSEAAVLMKYIWLLDGTG
jgi:hypothetical protein